MKEEEKKNQNTLVQFVFYLQGPNTIPADIVFIVRQKTHPLYVREQNDLIYKIQISLEMVSLRTFQAMKISFGCVSDETVALNLPTGFDWVLCGCADTGRPAAHHSHQRYCAVGASVIEDQKKNI